MVVACWGALVLAVALLVWAESVSRSVPGRSVAVMAAAGLLFLWAFLWFVLARRQRRMVLRKRRGLCLKCGYPRKHQQAGICTECGEVPWWDDHELAQR
ncbi:MAG: hypothetical protein QM783_04345 [Phycisphaerales bacterium]